MVTIGNLGLSLNGAVFNPGKEAAFQLPTAFSGAQVSYGGESCADNPDAGALAGRVFIPAQHAAFYPSLADQAALRATINGEDMRIFAGQVDELSIKDVAGAQLPELIPNSQAMDSLAGWEVRQGTSWATAAAWPADYLLGGARVAATGPVPADYDQYIFIRPPAAPIEDTAHYVLTVMAQAPIGAAAWTGEWLDAAGAVLYEFQLYMNYAVGAGKGEYLAQYSAGLNPSYGATQLRLTAAMNLDTAGEPWQQGAAVDGITLHRLPAGKYELAEATQLPRPAGRWVTFKASDTLATAARLVVGTTPWPQHSVESRTQALNAIVPASRVTFGFGSRDPYALLAPRDIDKQNTLEIYQRILASAGDLAVASADFAGWVVPAALPRFPQVLADVAGVATIVTDPNLPVLPAGAIQDGELQTDVTTMANQVRVEYRTITSIAEQKAEDTTALYVNDAGVAAHGAMGRSMATDLADVAGSVAEAKAQRLAITQAEPYYRLADNLRLVASQLPDSATLAKIYSAERGFGQLVLVDGAPELLGQYHRIRGALLTFGRQPAAELDVEPSDYAAPEPLSFADTDGTPRPAPFDTLTLGSFENSGITIGDLERISALEA